jgi:YgiT-type zinc finger domain-containing protein
LRLIEIINIEEPSVMKTCPFCKGNIELKKITHVHKWGNDYYLFEDIKTEVCRQCGEIFFLPETVKLMDEYVREKKVGEKTICIPVIKMPDMVSA